MRGDSLTPRQLPAGFGMVLPCRTAAPPHSFFLCAIRGLQAESDLSPVEQARLQALINEELAWGDVGLAITTGLTQFHVPWAQATGDAESRTPLCSPSWDRRGPRASATTWQTPPVLPSSPRDLPVPSLSDVAEPR